jgi:hypothetical protein
MTGQTCEIKVAGRALMGRGSHRMGRSPFPIAEWNPKAQICDADHRRARRGLLYRRQQAHTRWEHVMTWTSDRAGVVFYTVLGTLIVLSSIYIPA